jgi:hypothetical protein
MGAAAVPAFAHVRHQDERPTTSRRSQCSHIDPNDFSWLDACAVPFRGTREHLRAWPCEPRASPFAMCA